MLNLVLAGMVISSLFTAATSYLKLVADPTNQLPEITYWLMGSLSGTRLADVARILPAMAAGPCSPWFPPAGGSSTCSPWGTIGQGHGSERPARCAF